MRKIGVSYYGFTDKEIIKKSILEISSAGFDCVVLAVSENDLRNFRGAVAYAVKTAKQLKIEVMIDLWGFGSCFGGEVASHFLSENPDSRQITNRGRQIPMACLANKRFKEYMIISIKEITKMEIDGIFFDEPHFFYDVVNKEYACFCKDCKSAFFKRERRKLKNIKDVKANKSDIVTQTISLLAKEAKSIKPLIISVCIFPKERDDAYSWDELCIIPEIDIFGSDPYWNDPYWRAFFSEKPSYAGKIAKEVVGIAKKYGKLSEIWVQAFGLLKGEEKEIAEAFQSVLKEAPDRIMFWTYKCGWGSSIASDNPELCWTTVLEVVKEVKNANKIKTRSRKIK